MDSVSSESPADELIGNLNQLEKIVTDRFGTANSAHVTAAVHQLINVVKATPKNDDPFSFDDSIRFTYGNAIMALGAAINELLSDQPGLIASDMGISNGLVSKVMNDASNYWLGKIKDAQTTITNLPSDASSQQVAAAQSALTVANANSTASSTSLNGVMSMVTQGVSSKTSSYQNLVQQANGTVSSLLSFISQLWVI